MTRQEDWRVKFEESEAKRKRLRDTVVCLFLLFATFYFIAVARKNVISRTPVLRVFLFPSQILMKEKAINVDEVLKKYKQTDDAYKSEATARKKAEKMIERLTKYVFFCSPRLISG